MKSLQKQLALFIYLFFFLSTAKANNPSSQNSFEFLNIPLENATFVENGPALIKNTGVLALSTVINTGIWWTICKAPGFISAMTKKHPFTDLEKQEVKSIKSDFCGQLAPLITTAETALAGQVSPWPIDPLWWQFVFLTSAGMTAYASRRHIPRQSAPLYMATVVLSYLTAEGVSRTVGSYVSSTILKKIEANHITDTGYYTCQYWVLAFSTGLITGSIIYEILTYKKGALFYASRDSALSGSVASVLLTTIFMYNAEYNTGFDDMVSFFIGVNAVVGALLGGSGVLATDEAKVKLITLTGALAGAGAGAATGVKFAVKTVAGLIAEDGAAAKVAAVLVDAAIAASGAFTGIIGAALGGREIGSLSIMRINKLARNNYPLKLAGAAAIATSLAILNSLSGFAAYGYPLEQSLSETTQTLWNKFLAPLDYIATLFPQLLSKHELEE